MARGPTRRAIQGEADLIAGPPHGSVVGGLLGMKHKNRLQSFENATDLLTVGLIIALGLAMVVGLLTASGNVTW
jgi:hypothetical protein